MKTLLIVAIIFVFSVPCFAQQPDSSSSINARKTSIILFGLSSIPIGIGGSVATTSNPVNGLMLISVGFIMQITAIVIDEGAYLFKPKKAKSLKP